MAKARTRRQNGSIRKLPSGRWLVRYHNEHGARVNAPHTFTTKADADTWLAMRLADMARGIWIDPQRASVTLKAFAESYLDSRKHQLAASTYTNQTALLRNYLCTTVGGMNLGSMTLGELSATVLRQWQAKLQATPAARSAGIGRRIHPARQWAAAQGIAVPQTGKLPESVIAAWRDAGAPVDQPTARAMSGDTAKSQAWKLLKQLLAAAEREDLIAKNPCKAVEGIKAPKAKRTPLNAAQLRMLAESVPPAMRVAVLFAGLSGLRDSEQFALQRRHIDLETGAVRVEQQLLDSGEISPILKTASSYRTVILPAFLVDELAQHFATAVADDDDALVFLSVKGKPITAAHRARAWWRDARAAIGRPDLHWHDLRHTAMTMAAQTGAPQAVLMAQMGHSTPRAAQIYQHSTDTAQLRLAAGVNESWLAESNVLYLPTARKAVQRDTQNTQMA